MIDYNPQRFTCTNSISCLLNSVHNIDVEKELGLEIIVLRQAYLRLILCMSTKRQETIWPTHQYYVPTLRIQW